MDTASLIAQACPKINAMGSAFYFSPETVAKGKEAGLDGFRLYVLGRGGVLGDVEAPVIASAFGWWNGALVAKMWNSARETMSPRDAGRFYMACAHDLGRAKFGNVDGLAEFCVAGEKIMAAVDPAGIALYAGTAAEPLAEDLPARAMQILVALREFRGSVHINAVLASGLTPKVAHYIKRPDMMKSFGYSDDALPVTDSDHEALAAAEKLTDVMVTPAFSALSSDEADVFVNGLSKLEEALK
jgi:hypothetical protein